RDTVGNTAHANLTLAVAQGPATTGPGRIRPETISPGGDNSCAVTTGGGVKCWGYNEYGKLGDGTTRYLSTAPVDVVGLDSGVASVSSGNYHSCAVTTG